MEIKWNTKTTQKKAETEGKKKKKTRIDGINRKQVAR